MISFFIFKYQVFLFTISKAEKVKMYHNSICVVFVLMCCYWKVISSVCPPVNEIAPYCTCDGSDFLCETANKPNEPWDIVTYFDKVSTLIPEDTVYEKFLLGLTDFKEIPAGAFKKMKFINITIRLNDKLEVIHPDAFDATLETTTKLFIDANVALTNERLGDPSYDIFNVIRKFKKLENLVIYDTPIQSLPDNAFGSLPNLVYRRFRFSDEPAAMHKIGSKPFAGLPNLQILMLEAISSTAEIAKDAFESVAKDVDVYFGDFNLSKLLEKMFKPLLENARQVEIDLPLENEGMDCNEESAWICKDVPKYQSVLKGFVCRKDSEFNDIFDYCEKVVNQI